MINLDTNKYVMKLRSISKYTGVLYRNCLGKNPYSKGLPYFQHLATGNRRSRIAEENNSQ